ncbi:unnamed protein product [Didymodactylos carnosus]|uniref:Aminoacyl-transfer RNA synthetases class-II family profile domain-containing protein n=1 Tax=Didymodactylos carnosus TaxID=1234261 RepID=A0A8S2XP50_9BILA|nr:unnamed protein product [Didymodactylos carnosus]CAF4505479.1 unnamed protein product [Didymodactylos carnosus]
MPFFLRIAPELYLKRCIIGGISKVYEIGRLFRNEGMDATHNPEFTSMEAYCAFGDMDSMMELGENIVHFLADKLERSKVVGRNGEIILSKPFTRIRMDELVKREAKVDFQKIKDVDQALNLAQQHKIEVLPHQRSIGHILNLFFEKYGEPACIQPTFVYHYPLEISPLARKNVKETNFTDRFELFIDGREIMNAFSELTDPLRINITSYLGI